MLWEKGPGMEDNNVEVIEDHRGRSFRVQQGRSCFVQVGFAYLKPKVLNVIIGLNMVEFKICMLH